jgi:hypothetical protein
MPTQPEYDGFVAEARQGVAEQMALVERWQEQARRLVETGEGDVRAGEANLDK